MSQEGTEASTQPGSVGYWPLLRDNRHYRRLWFGLVVSMAGDWFRTIAVYLLVLRLTGASGLALGGVLIAQTLSIFLMSPLAGVCADRFSRKAIMISADVVRAFLTLGFLFISAADRLWLAYVLTAAIMAVSAFFIPAHTATIPNITKRQELVAANALASATWAAMLAIGAGLGGVVAATLGTTAAFLIDAATYVLSAVCIATVAIPAHATEPPGAGTTRKSGSWQDFLQGLHYIGTHAAVLRLLSVKAWSVGVGGGLLLLLTLFADSIFHAGATGLGLLYMARGLGAMMGPIVARYMVGDEPRAMQRAIGVAFLLTAGFYMAFARMPTLAWAAGALFLATMAANVLWVFSSTLLQISVPDAYRGRVFAADFALFTIIMALSTFGTGWALDHAAISVRTLTTILGSLLFLPGVLWLWSGARHASPPASSPG